MIKCPQRNFVLDKLQKQTLNISFGFNIYSVYPVQDIRMDSNLRAAVFIFVLTFFIDFGNTRSVNINKAGRKQRVLKVFNDSDCLYTYTAVQPNLDVIKEKVAEITVDRCAVEKRKQAEWVKKQKKRKKIRMRKRRMGKQKSGRNQVDKTG